MKYKLTNLNWDSKYNGDNTKLPTEMIVEAKNAQDAVDEAENITNYTLAAEPYVEIVID